MIDFTPTSKKLATYWLFVAVVSLALAGVYAILLVGARSPGVQELIPWVNVFQTALTIHVNLSVLVWFLAFACMFWVMSQPKILVKWELIPLALSVLAIVLMCAAPFLSPAEPLLNNYIPMLDSTWFEWAIELFLTAVSLKVILTLFALRKSGYAGLTHHILASSCLIYILSAVALSVSRGQLAGYSDEYSTAQYYELLYWGNGHLLQFLYTHLMMFGWLWLLQAIGFNLNAYTGKITSIFYINSLCALITFAICFVHPATTEEHVQWFTTSMQYFGGLAPVLLGLLLLPWLTQQWKNCAPSIEKRFFFWSVVLFASGGIISLFIDGINTIIPAHYHGSIVGVTLALMGVVCNTLPKLGFAPLCSRFLALQPAVYGVGQLLHITGFAWSGGYGALRKTPGAMESLEGQATMGLMGLGGLLSVIGGLLFVVICIKSCRAKQNKR